MNPDYKYEELPEWSDSQDSMGSFCKVEPPLCTVRMILQDYDSAPDGTGTYIRLDGGFASVDEALRYRATYLRNLYWGMITDIYGKPLVEVKECES